MLRPDIAVYAFAGRASYGTFALDDEGVEAGRGRQPVRWRAKIGSD
jgi:hypothetical protein